MSEYKEEILQKAFERGYQRGIRLSRLGIITTLLMQNHDQDFISKVTETSALEIELVLIAMRMFQGGENIEYVTQYTKFNNEEAEKIKDCTVSKKV
ncbi:hypothetical protein ACUH7Y_00825 [Clostridium beijerinckii]|uniref:Uncharacterized protein n=1 Tax=Clostridium beijerinckii TaxID=1520 RepID=A0A7X9SS61_CLOBE|nr:hypothetical protein [Clostridium beijerinckii]NMF06882.1 hypothetical protein [Clostridium beijerinckii]